MNKPQIAAPSPLTETQFENLPSVNTPIKLQVSIDALGNCTLAPSGLHALGALVLSLPQGRTATITHKSGLQINSNIGNSIVNELIVSLDYDSDQPIRILAGSDHTGKMVPVKELFTAT